MHRTQYKQMGGFRLQSFGLVHDTKCVGYLIGHDYLGKMIYVTDTSYVRYRFQNLNVILTECNWSEEFINRNEPHYRHVLTGHLSLKTCMDMVEANMNDNLRQVVLCHVSGDHGDSLIFRNAIKGIVGPYTDVKVAEPGSVIDLSEIPF